MAEENIRLELTKAFIIAGIPIEQIPAKVESLEAFCEEGRQFEEDIVASSEEADALAREREERAARRAAVDLRKTRPDGNDRRR